MSIKCLPNYSTQLQGRIFLDLLNEPDGMEIMWGGGTRQAPLEDYYFAVIEAIDSRSPGQALFLIQVGILGHLVCSIWLSHGWCVLHPASKDARG